MIREIENYGVLNWLTPMLYTGYRVIAVYTARLLMKKAGKVKHFLLKKDRYFAFKSKDCSVIMNAYHSNELTP